MKECSDSLDKSAAERQLVSPANVQKKLPNPSPRFPRGLIYRGVNVERGRKG